MKITSSYLLAALGFHVDYFTESSHVLLLIVATIAYEQRMSGGIIIAITRSHACDSLCVAMYKHTLKFLNVQCSYIATLYKSIWPYITAHIIIYAKMIITGFFECMHREICLA